MTRYYADIRVSGNKEDLKDFLLLCRKIEYLCSVGASRKLEVYIDGDGSANLRFDFGDVEVSLDTKKFEEQLDSKIEPIYIGE